MENGSHGADHVDEEKLSVERTDDEVKLMAKRDAIRQACNEHDMANLIHLADTPGGLLEDELRRAAWPMLLGCAGDQDDANNATVKAWQDTPSHRDEEQVQRDVDRAFVYNPDRDSEKTIQSNKAKLFDLIAKVLRTHRMLCYFQGYHDIVQVLLLVLGEANAYPAVARLSLCRIRDYMLPLLTPTIKHLRLIPEILQAADAALAQHLSQTEPYFALSATLTLYAHNIQAYSDIARLYDFILAHEPVMSIYLFTSIILQRRSELMAIPVEESDILHVTLSRLPDPLDLEGLISATLKLFKDHPPESLPGGVWRNISANSVLKTARSIEQPQDLEYAEMLFAKQEVQLAREERIKKGLVYINRNRIPIASVGTALAVGVLAIWLQRSGIGRTVLTDLWQVLDPVSRRR